MYKWSLWVSSFGIWHNKMQTNIHWDIIITYYICMCQTLASILYDLSWLMILLKPWFKSMTNGLLTPWSNNLQKWGLSRLANLPKDTTSNCKVGSKEWCRVSEPFFKNIFPSQAEALLQKKKISWKAPVILGQHVHWLNNAFATHLS